MDSTMPGSDLASNGDHSTVEFRLPQQEPPQPRQLVPLDFFGPVVPTPATNVNGGDSAAAPPAPAPAPPAAAAALAPVLALGALGGSFSEPPLRRKRGRPRKYPTTTPAVSQSGGAIIQPGEASAGGVPGKRPRGRPRGSRNKIPKSDGYYDVITVKEGEDLAAKIMNLSQSSPRSFCIASANGSISNATIRQPSSSGGTVTYEGRFEILSLVGTFLAAEDGSEDSRYAALSISLSGPDGQVFGGAVEGLLIAAAPIKVVLTSFKPVKQIDTAQPSLATGGQSRSPSLGSESSRGLESSLN